MRVKRHLENMKGRRKGKRKEFDQSPGYEPSSGRPVVARPRGEGGLAELRRSSWKGQVDARLNAKLSKGSG